VQDGRVYILDGGNRAGTFAKALELEWKEELGEESTSFEGDRKFCLEEGTYGLVCAAQQLEINIGKRLVKLSYLKFMQLGGCGGRLLSKGEGCCVVLWCWFERKKMCENPKRSPDLWSWLAASSTAYSCDSGIHLEWNAIRRTFAGCAPQSKLELFLPSAGFGLTAGSLVHL
jgi:hypothetical protein